MYYCEYAKPNVDGRLDTVFDAMFVRTFKNGLHERCEAYKHGGRTQAQTADRSTFVLFLA